MNDTLYDLLGIMGAFLVYPLVVLVPGFVIGWATDVLGFRTRTTSVLLLLSLVLSVAFCPMLTFLLARCCGMTWVWGAYAGTWLAVAALVLSRRVPMNLAEVVARCREYRLASWLVAAWLVIALFSMVDLQIGDRLYGSVINIDYAKHAAVTGSLLRTGVPPANPFFSFGWPQPLCYYYLWHFQCALVGQICGGVLAPRLVIYAGTLWSDLSLIVVIVLFVRLLPLPGRVDLRRQVTASVALLYVTGLDIIPVAVHSVGEYLNHELISSHDIEWWNDQVSSWFTSMLWVPQHVASLVASLAGLLILQTAPRVLPLSRRLLLAGLCGLAYASAIGMSLWVALVLAAGLVAWGGYSLMRGWRWEVVNLALSGAFTVLFSLRFLIDFRAASPYATSPVVFTVRRFFPAMAWCQSNGWGAEPYLSLANLLALPVNYFFEFGFYSVVAFLYWRSRSRSGTSLSPNEALYVCLFAVSAVISTFLRTAVRNNDLGWRGFLFAQFALLLWAGHFYAFKDSGEVKQEVEGKHETHGWFPYLSLPARRLLEGTLTLGVLSTAVGLLLLRCHPIYKDLTSVQSSTQLTGQEGRLAFNARDAYTWVDAHLSKSAVVQQCPRQNPYFCLYSNRRSLVSDLEDPYVYGPPTGVVDLMAAYAAAPFTCGSEATPASIAKLARLRNISCLVVFPEDPVWQNKGSWVWRCRPAYTNVMARVYVVAGMALDSSATELPKAAASPLASRVIGPGLPGWNEK